METLFQRPCTTERSTSESVQINRDSLPERIRHPVLPSQWARSRDATHQLVLTRSYSVGRVNRQPWIEMRFTLNQGMNDDTNPRI